MIAVLARTEQASRVKSAAWLQFCPDLCCCVSLVFPSPLLSGFLFEAPCLFLGFLHFISCHYSVLQQGVELLTPTCTHCSNKFSCLLEPSAVGAGVWWVFQKGFLCTMFVCTFFWKSTSMVWQALLYFRWMLCSFHLCSDVLFEVELIFLLMETVSNLASVKTNICTARFKSNFYSCLAVLNLSIVLKIWIIFSEHERLCNCLYIIACWRRWCRWSLE